MFSVIVAQLYPYIIGEKNEKNLKVVEKYF
jgi:hypothetical protein